MIIQGDCIEVLKGLPDRSVQCCVTSPPYYGLRDYGTAKWEGGNPDCIHEPDKSSKSSTLEGGKDTQGSAKFFRTTCSLCGAIRIDKQIGLEPTPDEYVAKLVSVFREVKRVLKDDGTLWLNLGDSYAGSGMGAANYPDSASEKQKSNHGSTTAKGRGGMTYGLKAKDLIGIPWMVAFALRDDGWYLRSDIIWHKPNPMPESVKDRPTKAHEYIFLLAKSQKYYYDYEAILEPANEINWQTRYDRVKNNQKSNLSGPKKQDQTGNRRYTGFNERYKNLIDDGKTPNTMHLRRADGLADEDYLARNKRDVWTVTTKPYKEAHFATFPPDLIEPCILAGSRPGDIVLDPFNGSGTTGMVAIKYHRDYIGIELNPKYIELTEKRLKQVQPVLA